MWTIGNWTRATAKCLIHVQLFYPLYHTTDLTVYARPHTCVSPNILEMGGGSMTFSVQLFVYGPHDQQRGNISSRCVLMYLPASNLLPHTSVLSAAIVIKMFTRYWHQSKGHGQLSVWSLLQQIPVSKGLTLQYVFQVIDLF